MMINMLYNLYLYIFCTECFNNIFDLFLLPNRTYFLDIPHTFPSRKRSTLSKSDENVK